MFAFSRKFLFYSGLTWTCYSVFTRVKLVQTAAVEYFTDTLQIGHHFDAFRKFLLLEDGEFGHSLCNEIFKKVSIHFKCKISSLKPFESSKRTSALFLYGNFQRVTLYVLISFFEVVLESTKLKPILSYY